MICTREALEMIIVEEEKEIWNGSTIENEVESQLRFGRRD